MFLIVWFSLLTVLSGQVESEADHAVQLPQWVDQIMGKLSLEEKIGQMLQIRCYPDYAGAESADYPITRQLIQKYHVGSILLGMHVTSSGPLRSSPSDVGRTANRLQDDSALPLLIAADLERGLASRMIDVPSFPWPMAFGALRDESTVEHFAAITAREARAVGIHWALAPVADINSNPSNPIINDRSFGENPVDVSTLVTAFIRGARKNGLLVTAKHFPGQGDASVDPHRGIVHVDDTIEHLKDIEFRPFKSAIDAGVDSIMVGHVWVSAIDPDKVATVSSKVVTEVLRGQMGFKGVILTDALEMKGISSLYDSHEGSPTALAAVDAVRAGCDVVMIPTDLDGAFHAIVAAVRSGEIPLSRIDESVRRILTMKASVGLNKSRHVALHTATELTSKPEDLAFAQQVADKAITLVRDNGRALPLRAAANYPGNQRKDSLVAILLAEGLEASSGHEFENALRIRRPDASVYYVDNRTVNAREIDLLKSIAGANDVIIVAFLANHSSRQSSVNGVPATVFGLMGPSGRFLQQTLSLSPENTIVIALGSPYLIEDFPRIQNYICAYAMASTSETSAVKALFGEIQNQARLPVTLREVAPLGFSLAWPTRQTN